MRALGSVGRALLAASLLAAAAGCTSVNQCAPGTVLIDVTLASGAEQADQLQITIALGGPAHTTNIAHQPGSSEGTVEIDFHNGYPAGTVATVMINALAGGVILGSTSGTVSFQPGCTSTPSNAARKRGSASSRRL